MNPVSSIKVIDFCEWLIEQKGFNNNYTSIIFRITKRDSSIYKYASEYLRQKEIFVAFEKRVQSYFDERELKDLPEEYLHSHNYWDYYGDLIQSLDDYLNRFKHQDFQLLEQRLVYTRHNEEVHRLVDSTIIYLVERNPNVLALLINKSELELSEELSFLEWMAIKKEPAEAFCKMPYDIYADYVERYIKENDKGNTERYRLLRDYQNRGWKRIIEEVKVLFRFKQRKEKSISDIFKRYLSGDIQYKCIVLPLSDNESQIVYKRLINDSWKDLNSCTGNYMDIYYSESDTGKSGFDIAAELETLPDKLKKKAPCLIIWKNRLSSADSISINDLDNHQIVDLIRMIVEDIQTKKEFGSIIVEARNKVKEMQDSNKGVNKNYYAPVINGDHNTVGDNNVVGEGNVFGNNNTVVTDRRIDSDSKKELLVGINEAIDLIKASEELDNEMKAQLNEIMNKAKTGIEKDSKDQQENAKGDFGRIKVFLAKVAPVLIQSLAGITTIAAYFGLKMHS